MKRKIQMDSYLSDNSEDNYKGRSKIRKDSIEGSVSGESYFSSADDQSDSYNNANNRKLALKDNSGVNNNFIDKNSTFIHPQPKDNSPYEDLDKYEPPEISNDIVLIALI
jgi:hypothetical protein